MNTEYDLAATVFFYFFIPFNLFNIFVDNKIKLNNLDLLPAAIDAQFANFVKRAGYKFI